MRNLVVFSTLTGNTEKIARAIFSVVRDEKEIVNIKNIEDVDIEKFEKIIIGYWVDKGDADDRIKKFILTLKNKKVSTFGTLGADPNSDHAKNCVVKVRERLEANGNIVEKEFICRGAIDPKLLEKFRKMTQSGMTGPHAATPESEVRWAEAAKHPDEKDIMNAKQLFKDY